MMTPGPTASSVLRRRALIVEDSEFVHQIYRVAFRRLGGWDLLHANNGQEGLDAAIADGGGLDLVIVDINMPVMGGLEFLVRLRAHDRFRAVPVLVASTDVNKPEVKQALAASAQSVLKKPFTLEQILETVGRVVPHVAANA